MSTKEWVYLIMLILALIGTVSIVSFFCDQRDKREFGKKEK